MDMFRGPNTYTFPEPREWQVRAIEELRAGFRDGKRNQLLVVSTGAGKTIAAMMLIAESLKKGWRATFVCDRITLINQTSKVADALGMHEHGVIQADHWRRDNSLPFQIASIQTIQARGYWPQQDLLVFDEAHTLHQAHREMLESGRTPVIGLTATPCTKGLGNYFSGIVNGSTMHELTQAGVLVPLRILTCVAPDMSDAQTVAGEWTAKSAGDCEAKIIGDVVGEWIAHANTLKTIAFGANIDYCNQLVQRFNAAGVNAAAYTSETSDEECAELLAEFRKPDSQVRILVSVEKLAKGFDVKDVGCVIDARPLRKSLSTAIQMWGRGLRSAPGKTECLLMDFAGNARRFLPDFEDVYFNGFRDLDTATAHDSRVREESDISPSGCPSCGRKPFHKRCIACGYEKPLSVLEDSTQGVMQEIRIGKRGPMIGKRDLWNELCSFSRQNPSIKKPAGFAYHKYLALTGVKPRWSYDDAPTVPVSSAVQNQLRRMQIAYHKARAE